VKESAGCFKRCAAGLTDPLYEQTSGSVRLTLSGEPLHRELDARLPDETRAIVSALREAERLSTGELAEVAGIARPTMIRYLQRLKMPTFWTGWASLLAIRVLTGAYADSPVTRCLQGCDARLRRARVVDKGWIRAGDAVTKSRAVRSPPSRE
jgi:hypothetical protein